MVLEKIYPSGWLENRPWSAFVLGFAYSVFGLFLALFLFPQEPSMVAVALTAILLIPTIDAIVQRGELNSATKESVGLGVLTVHRNMILAYLFAFLGVFTTFAIFSTVLPTLAAGHLFSSLLSVRYGSVGQATFSQGLFKSLLSNNLKVMVFCFVSAFIIGDSGLFIITLNASVWGTLFGDLAKNAAASTGKAPLIYLGLVIIAVFPHMITEALAYFSAAAAGGLISVGVEKEKSEEKRSRVMNATLLLLALAIGFVILGAIIETYMLNNNVLYQRIIQQGLR